jgi:4'-phosphopantetheinyl transferase
MLSSDDVHLWWTSTNVSEGACDVLSQVLSPDEHERVARFVFARDRRRFVVARAMLRSILARYLGWLPQEIGFQYEPHGKPRLRVADSGIGLEFNLAHSYELVLCAVSRGRQVGVDIERLQPVADLEQLAAVAFSHTEQATLSALAGEQQLIGFFNCWTRKEAYVKARGDGLLMPLNEFDVSLAPGEPVALLANRLDPHDIVRWSLHEVLPANGYVGAIAVEGQGTYIHLRQWDRTKTSN